MIKKKISVDLIEVLENGNIQVRTATRFVEDGKVIGTTLHRQIIEPGQEYSGECERVKAICAVVHTAEVISDRLAQAEPAIEPETQGE